MHDEQRKKRMRSNSSRRSVRRSAKISPLHASFPLGESYRILFDTMSQGVLFRDAQGRCVAANPAAVRIIGRDLDEMLGTTSAELHAGAVQEDGSPLPAGEFPSDIALRTGRPVIGRVLALLNPRDRAYRWLSVDAMPVRKPGKEKPFLVYILFDDISEQRRTAAELRAAHDYLEQEVQERTHELRETNLELSSQIAERRSAEQALRESEERFRRLAENAEDLIYLFRLRPERRFEYVSPSSTALTGYTPEEHYANPDLGDRLVHSDDRHLLAEVAEGRIEPGKPVVLRWVRKDGRTIWTEQRNVPIRDADGRLVAVQGIVRDITERHRIEEKLRESERFLQTVIESEPECVKLLGADGTVMMMNRAGLEMIDAESLEQVQGRSVYPLVNLPYRQDFMRLTEQVFQGKSGALAFEATGLKGRSVWLETHAVPLRDENNEIMALLGITRDITQRIRAEEKLRASEKFLQTVIDTEPECVKLLDAGGTVLMMNRAGLEMIQAEASDQIRGRAADPLIAPEHRKPFARLLEKVFRGTGGTLTFEMVGLQGRRLWMDTHMVPLRDEAGKIIAALGITRDITERRKMEQRLRDSERNLREAQRLAGVGSWDRDPRTQEVHWSPEVFKILGCNPAAERPSFERFRSAVHPQDRSRVAEALDEAFLHRKPYDVEFRIVRPDGSERIVHARAEVTFDDTGAAVKIIGTLQDLTERRRTEELLTRIAQNISQRTGDAYFRAVTEFVVQELGTDIAFIGEHAASGRSVRTVVVHDHGTFKDNFEYDLDGAPCGAIRGSTPCFFPERIRELFPRDHLLADLSLESYAGIPLFDSLGRPLGILATLGRSPMRPDDRERIITLLQIFSARASGELERKRAEEALVRSEQRYRELLESITTYMYTVMVSDGRPVATSHGPGCVAVTGYTSDEYAADPRLWYHMIYDEDRPLVLRQTTALMAGGRPGPIEHRIRHKNGSIVWVQSAVVPRVDGEGRLTAYDGLITDITARKRAEDFSRSILESVDEGFLIIGRDYSILSANRAYAREIGLTPSELIGRSCYAVTHGNRRPCHQQGEECAVLRCWETGQPQSALHTHADPSGGPLYIETKAFPLRDASGEITAAIETITDVTEHRRLEEQLRHAQKMEAVGLLAGGVAHDFNNILTAIVGYGNLLRMKMPPEDSQSVFLEQILAAAARGANLTRSLLAFSRKQTIHPRPIDLNETIRRIEGLLHRVIGEDIDLRPELADGELTVLADSSQMEQVLMNLATNARDAMPAGGTITITTATALIDEAFRKEHGFGTVGRYACVSVEDTGAGMDKGTLEHIFEPFFTTKGQGRGTGLGLAIVYGIMKQNSGYVLAESEPGKGARFRLFFPLIAGSSEQVSVTEATAPAAGNETLLIAEDDATIRALLGTMLREFGYTVLEAGNGEEAVRLFSEHRDAVRLVILDVVMPKMTGKEAHDAIIALEPEVKTLYLSGYNSEIVRSKGVIDDTANFLLKPISPMDLLRTVRRILDDRNGPPSPAAS